MKSEKITAQDLYYDFLDEMRDCIWVRKFSEYKCIEKIFENMNKNTVIIFEDKTSIICSKKRKFELM